MCDNIGMILCCRVAQPCCCHMATWLPTVTDLETPTGIQIDARAIIIHQYTNTLFANGPRSQLHHITLMEKISD